MYQPFSHSTEQREALIHEMWISDCCCFFFFLRTWAIHDKCFLTLFSVFHLPFYQHNNPQFLKIVGKQRTKEKDQLQKTNDCFISADNMQDLTIPSLRLSKFPKCHLAWRSNERGCITNAHFHSWEHQNGSLFYSS